MGKNMFRIVLGTILCCFVSCGPPMPPPSRFAHVNRAYAINRQTDCKLQRRGFFQNITSYRNQDKIWKFIRYYETKSVQFKDIDEARYFYFKLIDEFLAPLNADAEIRPFFKEYPLTWKNLDLSIDFYATDGTLLTPPYISLVGNNGDDFVCKHYDEKLGYIVIYEEPMSVAYEKYVNELQNEKQSL